MKIEIELPADMDLDHTLECVTDALYFSDCITYKEQEFIIKLIQQIKKQKRNEQQTNSD
jgi:hypothetical protein